MVKLKGATVGRRVVEVLRIYDCEVLHCNERQSRNCLIGKEIEISMENTPRRNK